MTLTTGNLPIKQRNKLFRAAKKILCWTCCSLTSCNFNIYLFFLSTFYCCFFVCAIFFSFIFFNFRETNNVLLNFVLSLYWNSILLMLYYIVFFCLLYLISQFVTVFKVFVNYFSFILMIFLLILFIKVIFLFSGRVGDQGKKEKEPPSIHQQTRQIRRIYRWRRMEWYPTKWW